MVTHVCGGATSKMSVMIDGAEAILVDRNKGDVIDYSNKNIHNYPMIIKCTLSKVRRELVGEKVDNTAYCCKVCYCCQEERAEANDIVTATLENTSWGPTKIATQVD